MVSYIDIIDMLGTLAFSISGASTAIRKELDIFGIIVIAFVASIGGGTLRDILLGNTPVAWLTDGRTISIILIGAIITIIFERWTKKLNFTLFIFDACGLGLFTMIGIQKGMDKEFTIGICVALGTMTACFGGVIRDILLNEIPLLFRKEIYASAAIIGGIIYYLLIWANITPEPAQILAIIAIVVIRIIAIKYKLSLPTLASKKT